MKLYLTHGSRSEGVFLTLPASPAELEEVDIRLREISRYEGDLRIADVKSPVKGLENFLRSTDPLDLEQLNKLNRLAARVDTMSEKETRVFSGVLLSESIGGLDDVLRTTENLNQYDIVLDVACDRALGGYLVDHGVIDCPEHLKPYLDYVGIGAEFYSSHGGAYTMDGYVVRKGELPAQLRPSTPEPWRDDNRDEMLRMTLCARGCDGYLLVLPADEEYLSGVKKYLGIDEFTEAEIRNVRFKVPYIGELMQTLDCPSVEEYNDFAEALEEIWQQDGKLLTYAAALDAEQPDTLHRARELLQDLDNYQRVTDAYDYGQQRLQETLGLDDEGIAELEGYMDFEKYGQDCMEHDGVVATEFGRLRRLESPFSEQTREMQMQGFL